MIMKAVKGSPIIYSSGRATPKLTRQKNSNRPSLDEKMCQLTSTVEIKRRGLTKNIKLVFVIMINGKLLSTITATFAVITLINGN
jgi:hypothetical protein